MKENDDSAIAKRQMAILDIETSAETSEWQGRELSARNDSAVALLLERYDQRLLLAFL